ncbi:MAG TPA: glycosyl hydrolase [Propionibacteriaceae bacterium]|nr:glycosyl hydrolase [Propionibacteriaceae bacterium]
MTESPALDELRRALADPPIETRPEIRWWLAEGVHTDETLRTEIEAAYRLGFGGMEFLAMDEEGVDHARYGWGSEEWTHDSEVVVTETTARNMAVSFTSGTNWSNANLPTITPDEPAAAQELDVVTEDLAGGATRTGPLTPIDLEAPLPEGHMLPGHRGRITVQHLVAVIAAKVLDASATPPVLAVDSVIDLTGQVVDESLEWTAPDGDWKLFTYWMHGTGQTANPSASVNYTVNYIDRHGVDAVIDYWGSVVLTPELRAQIAKNPRTQMYMDSLELSTYGAGGLFWGHTFAEEFRARRGYDIEPWLPFLTRSIFLFTVTTQYHYAADDASRTQVEKVRHDYVRTLTDLYIETMLRPFAEFLHGVGITLRSEISYGLPFELTRPGPEVDGIETESLEFGSQIDAYRLLAGPAHLFDKPYSSETGATTRNHVLDHRFYDQIIATQFAAGVTKTVLHGWASPVGAEGATEWPGHEGMWPMFSERFDTRQPAAEFYPLWTRAVARQQLLLRRGRPRVDVAILRTDHFVENMIGITLLDPEGNRIPDEDAIGRMWMRNRENQWWQDLGMQDAGWTYEYFDPELLLHPDVEFGDGVLQPGGPGYQAVIVYQECLDPDAASRLLELARNGLRVLLVHGAREVKWLAAGLHTVHEKAAARTPGNDGRDAELASTIASLLAESTVREISDPAQTVSTLRALGVVGRSEFLEDNQSVLGLLRDDATLSHLFLYNFLYETGGPSEVQVALQRPGAVHRVDPWQGTLSPYATEVAADGRLVISVTLHPGEVAFLTVDHEASAGGLTTSESVVTTLDDWQITVESWDAGDLEVITEDRGLGYVTREVRPHTAVTAIDAGQGPLKPWLDLPEVGPEVSGVGDYVTHVTVSDEDLADGGRLVLDLGSTAGGLGSVSVNGGAPCGFDTSRPRVDVTDELRPGDNEIHVRTASSLNNRLLARGYYDSIPDIVAMQGGAQDVTQKTTPHAHGLLGPVRLVRVA